MDPFSLTFSIVVVVLVLIFIYVIMKGDFICIYFGHVIVTSPANRVQHIHLKDTGCTTDNILTTDADTITDPKDFRQMRETQTEDSELFITYYDHVQAQWQENLIAADTIENIIDHFHESLNNILEHSNWNFQILAYQLRSEFHSYMQYALTQASASAIPVLQPVDFQMLQTSYVEKQEPLPNLHIKHYAVYEQKALQEADAEVERQAAGARPTDSTRPWSGQPYGCQTGSQASFAKRRARQEHYQQSKCQNDYRQVIVSTAIREALAHDSVPSPLKPYAENQHPYHLFTGPGCTGFSDDTDSALEDYRVQPSTDHPSSACNSATPRQDAFSEESSMFLQTIRTRGRASRAL